MLTVDWNAFTGSDPETGSQLKCESGVQQQNLSILISMRLNRTSWRQASLVTKIRKRTMSQQGKQAHDLVLGEWTQVVDGMREGTDMLVCCLDRFCIRQFDDPTYLGTQIHFDKTLFEDKINRIYVEKNKTLVDGCVRVHTVAMLLCC